MLQPASRTLWPERPPQISVSAPAWLSVLDVDSDGTVVRAHLVRPDERIPHPPHRAERADAQHENRGLTFWHEDDGTVVLHGRFPPEMGARILGALDAAMQAHATEQPASGWDNEGSAPEDVPGGTSVQGSSFADATINTRARETVSGRQRQDAQLFLADVPRGTFIRGPSRTVRRADPLTWVAERMFEPGDAPALAPDRHEIAVHVEAEVLADGPAGRCEIQHRTAIAAEVILTFAVDALTNHLAKTPSLVKAVAPLDLTEARLHELTDLKDEVGGRALVQRTLRDHIRIVTGATYDTPFFVRPRQSRRALWFLHLSRHPTARDVMIQRHWDLQNTFEHYGSGDFDMTAKCVHLP